MIEDNILSISSEKLMYLGAPIRTQASELTEMNRKAPNYTSINSSMRVYNLENLFSNLFI